MKRKLTKILICPYCRSDLQWDIFRQREENIDTAKINCNNCRKDFYVHNGIADFVIKNSNEKNDNINHNLKNFFNYESDLVNRLIVSNNRDLNISDIHAKLEYYKLHENYEEIDRIYKEYDFDIYTEQSKKALYECFSKLNDILSDKKDMIILDFAAGNVIMGGYLNDRIRFSNYIVNDLSINNLQVSKHRIVHKERMIDYLAFDLCNIPFKEKSIDYAISFVGFQNMIDFTCVIHELIRTVNKGIYHISIFCDKKDKINMMALRMANMQNSWDKQQFLEILKRNGLKYREIYSKMAEVDPLISGEIVKGHRVDRFPVVRTKLEYNLGEILVV